MAEPVLTPGIKWPAIEGVPLTGDGDVQGSEPVFLLFADGRREQGSLSRFDAGADTLEFVDSTSTTRDIRLDSLQEVRLTRPLRLKPLLTVPREGIESSARPIPYRIELVKGDPLVGESLGWKEMAEGIFLAVLSYGDAVVRMFVPRMAIRARKMGLRLGESLVSDKAVSEANLRLALAEQGRQQTQRLGEMLAENAVITREQLHAALIRQAALPMVRIGDTLVDMKLISPAQLESALESQKTQRDKPLGKILRELNLISDVDLARALSQRLGFPFVDLNVFKIDPDIVRAIPAAVVRELQAMPLCRDGMSIVVAMEQPLDSKALQRLRFVAQSPILPALAESGAIRRCIAIYYGEQKSASELSARLSSELVAPSQDEEPVKETDNTLVQLVNKIIVDAHAAQASDIHIECNRAHEKVLVRFRRDGVLTNYLSLPATFRAALVSRIKIMADIDISEHRRGQDGRIDFSKFGGLGIELRVAILPTSNGLEDVVMRLLGTSSLMPFEVLGFRESVGIKLKELIHRPHGLLIVCGPTGSGKTMTLHTLIEQINTPARKIWTAEDPVEITQSGLRQVQINSRIGWTFAAAIRMFLRADPDVIMVGEMRDVEASKITIEAALTGHLVFSTLHTNSAAESVVRLVDLGMDPFNFADSLLGVLGQRLARRLCEHCRRRRFLEEDEARALAGEFCSGTSMDPLAVLADWHARIGGRLFLYEAGACTQCRGTGYYGRIGIHELLVVDPAMRHLIHGRENAAAIHDCAVAAGMRTLRQDGIEKVLAGHLDLAEVRRATI